MSKRLRASMRAANKGRNLRPRASQVPPEAVPGDAPADAAPAEGVQVRTAPTSAPVTAPSPDRGRETVREPAVDRDDADEDEADEAPVALAGKPISTAPVAAPAALAAVPVPVAARAPVEAAPIEAAPPSDTQPSSPAMVPKVKEAASTAAPVQAPADSFKADKIERVPTKAETPKAKAEEPKAKVEEPKPVAKAEEPKPVAKVEEPKSIAKVEAPKAKVEEPKPVAKAEEPKAKVEAPKAKVEEPKSVAKVEEPKKAAPAPASKPAVAPKPVPEAAPASKKAEQTAAPPSKKGPPSKTDGEPGSRRPASLRAVKPGLEDDLDASSISAEFFRKDVDSLPPVEEHEPELDSIAVPVLSPSTLARRARLRRFVAGVVSFAGVISIAVIGKQVFASRRPVSTPVPAVVTEARVETPPAKPAEPAQVAVTEPAKAPVEQPKAADDKKADEAVAKADDKKADDKKADEAPAKADDKKADEAKPTGDVKALKKEAENLLNRGRNKDAAEKAREALALDPADADLYLYLGSALQSSGHWKEGVEAYCDCVRNATKGQVNECRAMGGHK